MQTVSFVLGENMPSVKIHLNVPNVQLENIYWTTDKSYLNTTQKMIVLNAMLENTTHNLDLMVIAYLVLQQQVLVQLHVVERVILENTSLLMMIVFCVMQVNTHQGKICLHVTRVPVGGTAKAASIPRVR